jgi:hypothetical protein
MNWFLRIHVLLIGFWVFCAGQSALGADNYEPNDTLETAYNLSSHPRTWLADVNGIAQAEDAEERDWFKITVPAGHRVIQVEPLYVAKVGWANMYVRDQNGDDLYYSGSYVDFRLPAESSGPSRFTVPLSETSETYYLMVAPYTIQDEISEYGSTYNFWWSTDDLYEQPADQVENDVLSNARSRIGHQGEWLSQDRGLGVQYDSDWYEINLSDAAAVYIDCQFTHADGDINIALYDAGGHMKEVSYDTSSDSEVIDFLAPSNGLYYIQVYGDNQGNTYDLKWSADDAYETNNVRTQAYDLTANRGRLLSTLSGRAVQYDEDWYKVVVPWPGGSLRADCLFTHADGDLDLQLVNSSGTMIAQSDGQSDDESVVTTVSGGTYYFRVYNINGESTGNDYDLRWTLEDRYEENDTRTTAQDLSGQEGQWLFDVQGPGYQLNDDWYQIEVPAGNLRVLIDCTFAHADGNVDIYLYKPDGTFLAGGLSSTDNESIFATVPASGTYYILVDGDQADNSYNLRWDSFSLSDDLYEENDTLAGAYDLSENDGDWFDGDIRGLAYQKDDDWYKIQVPAGSEKVALRCLFSNGDGNLDVGLYNAAGTRLAETQEAYDNEYITYVVPVAGTYYVKVFGPNQGTEYDFQWCSYSPYDDVYEENDYLTDGYYIPRATPVAYIGGSAIQRDSDFYKIFVPAANTHVQVSSTFTHADGNIDISFCNASGQILAVADSLTDNESLEYVVPAAGIYCIWITGDDAGNSYGLQWNGTPNQAPTSIQLSSSSVDENQPVGTNIGNLSTIDPDAAADSHTYALLTGSSYPDNAFFTISGTSLKTAATFDYATKSSYTVTVQSTDQGGRSVSQSFTVTVQEVTETPLVITGTERIDGNKFVLRWSSASTNRYSILSTTNLLNGFEVEHGDIIAVPPENVYTSTQ